MRSIADTVRERDRERLLARSPAERVAEALALGERDLAAYQQARGIDRATALSELRRARQRGRQPSVAAEE